MVDRDNGLPAADEQQQMSDDGGPRTYSISREGRRQAVVLLLGVLSLVVFAVWSLLTIVLDGVTGAEWVSGALLVALLVAAPFVAWALLEEMRAAVRVDADGITYSTLAGIHLRYAWSEVEGFKGREGAAGGAGRGKLARFFLGNDRDEEEQALLRSESEENSAGEDPSTLQMQVRGDPNAQISNQVVRFMHRQAYGSTVPIHGGLERRNELAQRIRAMSRKSSNTSDANISSNISNEQQR